MDVFYEESSTPQNFSKKEKRYKVIHVLSVIVLAITCIFLWIFVLSIGSIGDMIIWGMQSLFCFGVWFLLHKWKSGINVSYDYCFVSGDLRIAKVININKRKLVAKFDCAEIIQVGDVDSPAFDRFRSDPTTKLVLCTSNDEAADGKFFMYIHVDYNGKKLFVLECREELLIQMLKFMKRTALDHDYVSQEKKNTRNINEEKKN